MMGCILDFIADGLGELMCLIIPNKVSKGKFGFFFEMLAKLISEILMISIVFGIIFLINDDVVIKSIGTKMIYIPLIVYAVFIILVIIAKMKNR